MTTKTMSEQDVTTVKALTLDRVIKVYSGKAGKCCCGCAGKYYVPSSRATEADRASREVSDRMVKKIFDMVVRALFVQTSGGDVLTERGGYCLIGHAEVSFERGQESHAYIEVGARQYIVYFTLP